MYDHDYEYETGPFVYGNSGYIRDDDDYTGLIRLTNGNAIGIRAEHVQRLWIGIKTLAEIIVLGIVLLILVAIGQYLYQYAQEVVVTISVLLSLFVLTYLIGYARNGFRDDIRQWR